MKTTRLIISTIVLSTLITSCAVQQFSVNSEVQPFQNGGKIFGEKTNGKTIKKSGDLFLLGTNVLNSNTELMAKELDAKHYTIETKRNILSFFVGSLTGGLFDYKVVTVIKRDK
jgi:hypothetical protein